MDNSVTIFGDWGTSRLRLYLRQGKSVLDRRDGPGIGALEASPRETFLNLVGDWREAKPFLALLCGMVGSRNGWAEAAYAPCPANAADIRERLLHLDADGLPVAIVPGLSCRNALGGPDVMRGEETQILGALALNPDLARGRHLLALPGTHTKWVVVEDGAIASFLTAPVGELYALLREHSILAKAAPGDGPESPEGFARGVARIVEQGPARLPHLIFETRSRQLLDGLPKDEAMGFLSGLLIGSDVAATASWFGDLGSVSLIGAPALGALYAQAIAANGGSSVAVDGDAAVLAGLTTLSSPQNSGVHVLA
ncbi:2-dehydro-3-deoxygalactonokinase [Caulobacter sp. BE254]|uniref:2-dehydro-3-deoxygalactonokinase n=1 Tax=Caulobacter sp. BE254 TaxID=2817720 RepID=UPI002859D93E|nr:2-dehydro-3-deoxygalactonokinase [Caulobacter sp. BE254]MDR7118191.1 2-dehydro-3-deoxygalactonokinase [Caulobacter sp. BE254]